MRTVTISIELGVTEESLRAYGKARQKGQATRSTILTAWSATKAYSVARLRDFLAAYDEWHEDRQKQSLDQLLKELPPHSLFCEGTCCQKPFSTYHAFLKQELVWNGDGHLQ